MINDQEKEFRLASKQPSEGRPNINLILTHLASLPDFLRCLLEGGRKTSLKTDAGGGKETIKTNRPDNEKWRLRFVSKRRRKRTL